MMAINLRTADDLLRLLREVRRELDRVDRADLAADMDEAIAQIRRVAVYASEGEE